MADVHPEISDSDEENFEDASEVVPATELDLTSSINEAYIALELFLNNKFNEAREKMKPFAHSSIYHGLAYSTILFLQAVMTFEQHDIEAAMQAIKKALDTCNKRRKKNTMTESVSNLVKRKNYDLYTEEECHAELCYAECLLFRAILTFIQDENLISFIKGGLKIRACYQSYKECYYMLEHRTWNNAELKMHFEGGVLMGVGAFNLLISALPGKLLKLLEFVGFSGNEEVGLRKLHEAQMLKDSLNGPVCSLILICYHTLITYVIGKGTSDLEYTESILRPLWKKYPNGTLFLFFVGRLEEVKANFTEAVKRLEESVNSQSEWKQFKHICYWELMWCHSFQRSWREAWNYADKLFVESRWSKVIYGYQKAALMCMCQNELSPKEKEELVKLIKDLPQHKQRIAGKSIPMEKFCLKKCQQFLDQENKLFLPALEIMYIWNCFGILSKKVDFIHPFLSLTEKTMADLQKNHSKSPTFGDNYCLALLLKGVLLRHLKSPLQAEECFKEILQRNKEITTDTYLIPNAVAELGILHKQEGNEEDAIRLLEMAKNSYKGYSLESRLHFKVHSSLSELKKNKDNKLDASGLDSLEHANGNGVAVK